jgi:sugar lactone lactonase YvrE
MRIRYATGGRRSCARAADFLIGLIVLGWWPAPAAATTIYYTTNTAGELRRTDGRTTAVLLSGMATPRDFAFGPDGFVYVAEEAGNKITRFDPVTKKRVGTAFATARHHIGLEFGGDGLLYTSAAASDYNTGLIERYDAATGAAAGLASAPTSNRAQFTAPVTGVYFEGMEIGPDGNVYCAGWRTTSVEVYQGPNGPTPGALVAHLRGGLSKPVNMTFGPDGALYVAEYVNSTIMRYDADAGTFRTFASGSFLGNPIGMDFGPDGSLYVANNGSGKNNIIRIDGPAGAKPGSFLGVFATTTSQPAHILVVPEPSGAALLLVGATVVLACRSRRPRSMNAPG